MCVYVCVCVRERERERERERGGGEKERGAERAGEGRQRSFEVKYSAQFSTLYNSMGGVALTELRYEQGGTGV